MSNQDKLSSSRANMKNKLKIKKKNKKMESELFFSGTVNSVTKWQDLNGIVGLIVSTPDVNV